MTGLPSSASGHSGLSGIRDHDAHNTGFPAVCLRRLASVGACRAVVTGVALLGLAGLSASTSAAGLSSRSPLKAAWRTMPSAVQPANSISATSSGLSQWTSGSFVGAPMPVNGDFVVSTAFSRGSSCLTFGCAVARADAADIGEVLAAMNANQQRAETAVGRASIRR